MVLGVNAVPEYLCPHLRIEIKCDAARLIGCRPNYESDRLRVGIRVGGDDGSFGRIPVSPFTTKMSAGIESEINLPHSS